MENNQEPNYNPFERINNHWGMHLFRYITVLVAAMFGAAIFGILGVYLGKWFFSLEEMPDEFTAAFLKDSKGYATYYLAQVFASIGAFLFPALVQSSLMRQRMVDYLDLRDLPKPNFYIPAVVVVLCMMILNTFLLPFFQELGLPGFLSDFEKTLNEAHNQSVAMQRAFLNPTGPLNFIAQLFIIALLPAVVEEIFFRKLSLKMLFNLTRNAHVSIVISAILFSLIHQQVYNFIPIFLFGILLGYLALWSGSIWLPILAHFTNNFLSLVSIKLAQDGDAPEVVQDDYTAPWYILISALLLLSFLLRMMYLQYRKSYE